MADYWEIATAKVEVDSATFFKALAKYFPDATTFVVDEMPKILEDEKDLPGTRNYKETPIPEQWKSPLY